jgi:hypothetical protein
VSHPLQCRCGILKGSVSNPRSASRVVCYCKDCQAFAHFLGRDADVLDERGGSDVIQALPRNVTFAQGTEALACVRLTQKGLLRWYAGCCNTPIGNTSATPKISYVGLVHICLENPDTPLQDAFGPVRAWFHTNSARGTPKPRQAGLGPVAFWVIATLLKARLNGDYRHTPFFRADTGAPVVSPRVLSSGELTRVMNAVRAASA